MRVHVDIGTWELVVLQGLLNTWVELGHEGVEVRHVLGVVNSGSRPGLVQVLHGVDPSGDLLWLLVGIVNRVNADGSRPDDILGLNVLKLKNRLIFAI